MILFGVLVGVVLGQAEPCAPLDPLAVPDPDAAALYLQVGDEALTRGDLDVAVVALRKAARAAPDPEATAKWEAACARRGEQDEAALYARALERVDADDCAGALPLLEKLRARSPGDRSAALLEGSCRYQLGEDEAAAQALEVARTDPALEPSAALLLGLVRLRQGATADASAAFERAASLPDPALRQSVARLIRVVRSEAPLRIDAAVQAGWDSNPALLPLEEGVVPGGGEGVGVISATARAQPFGSSGPYAVAEVGHRRHSATSSTDALVASGEVGVALRRGGASGGLSWAYQFVAYGGAPNRGTHELHASGGVPLGSRARLWAEYELGLATMFQPELAGYSGVRNAGVLGATVFPADWVSLQLHYGLAREDDADQTLSNVDHGPGAGVALWLTERLRLGLDGEARFRTWDAIDLDLGLRRSEVWLDSELSASFVLSRSWSLFGVAQAQRRWSNASGLDHLRLAALMGVAFLWEVR